MITVEMETDRKGMKMKENADLKDEEEIQKIEDSEYKKFYWSGLLTGLLFALLIVSIGYLAGRIIALRQATKAEIQVDTDYAEADTEDVTSEAVIKKIDALTDAINLYYLGDVDTETIVNGIYDGILGSLGDPYSVYYTNEELIEILNQTEGIYYGIGAIIRQDPEKQICYISSVLPETPAEEAHLLSGDYILAINGIDCTGMTVTEVAATLRGESGTEVTITMARKGLDDFDVVLTRASVKTPTVFPEMLENQIGYIQITQFDTVTYGQFLEAYVDLQNQGMAGLIIDLRGNPGGNVSTVCDIARQILPEGLIVYTEDKAGERTEYSCDGRNEIQIPLVLLIDSTSASASEILAGAVQDYGIGTLVGTTTYGKGIVQRIISVSDGTAVKLTIANYYTPNGNYIHHIGIDPDIYVEFDSDKYVNEEIDTQLEAGIAELYKRLGITE